MNIVRGLVCRSVRNMCFATLIKLEKKKQTYNIVGIIPK
jgi:hypothetical protein